MTDFEITCPAFGDAFDSTPSNYNIKKLPYSYFLDGNIYDYDGGKLDNSILKKIKNGNLPAIAPFSVEKFIEIFGSILESGKDILHIDFSNYYSPNYRYAQAAWRALQIQFPDRKMHIIDSKRLGLGIAAYSINADKMRRAGKTLAETAGVLKIQGNANIDLIIAKDLTHLKRKGYISFMQKNFGLLKKTQPLLSFDKYGEIEPFAKVSGDERAIKEILSIIKNTAQILDNIIYVNCESDSQFLKSFIYSIKQESDSNLSILEFYSDIFTISKTGLSAVEITYFK